MSPHIPPTNPAANPQAKTRVTCDRTDGYNVKPGAHYYEWCPFCGHRTTEDDAHEIQIEIQD